MFTAIGLAIAAVWLISKILRCFRPMERGVFALFIALVIGYTVRRFAARKVR